jgi:hypothetical protein
MMTMSNKHFRVSVSSDTIVSVVMSMIEGICYDTDKYHILWNMLSFLRTSHKSKNVSWARPFLIEGMTKGIIPDTENVVRAAVVNNAHIRTMCEAICKEATQSGWSGYENASLILRDKPCVFNDYALKETFGDSILRAFEDEITTSTLDAPDEVIQVDRFPLQMDNSLSLFDTSDKTSTDDLESAESVCKAADIESFFEESDLDMSCDEVISTRPVTPVSQKRSCDPDPQRPYRNLDGPARKVRIMSSEFGRGPSKGLVRLFVDVAN